MRLSRLLSKHSADEANIQKSNSVNHFNHVQQFGRYEFSKEHLQFEILVKKTAPDQKRWQKSKNSLYKFD
jgi:hypothetical protein